MGKIFRELWGAAAGSLNREQNYPKRAECKDVSDEFPQKIPPLRLPGLFSLSSPAFLMSVSCYIKKT
jgi:hypothetical protein